MQYIVEEIMKQISPWKLFKFMSLVYVKNTTTFFAVESRGLSQTRINFIIVKHTLSWFPSWNLNSRLLNAIYS